MIKPAKLTQAQAAMLRNALDGRSLFYGLRGASAHGGANGTVVNLLRRGLIKRDGGITETGRAALTYFDGKYPNSRAP